MTKEFLGIMIRIMQENDQKNLINIQIRKLDDYGILVNTRTNGDIEALADAMRALKNHCILKKLKTRQKVNKMDLCEV